MESILLEDNPHWIDSNVYSQYTARETLDKALRYMKAREILAIIGGRRVGKSTLAKLIINTLLKSTDAKQIFFINLEKPDFIPYKDDSTYLQKIYEAYLKMANPNTSKPIYLFLDEVQIFQHWEIFVKSKYENSTIKFVITGSNSSLLTQEYATALTGRVIKLKVFSFNFREFLAYKQIDFSSSLQRTHNKIAIERALDEYLKWGGYYSVISNNDPIVKKAYLQQIAEDIILKDIVPRYGIKKSMAIKDLFYYVVSNAAAVVNYAKLARKLDIDPKMIKEYLGYFQDNFLISQIANFHTKLSQQLRSAKKIYLNDIGFFSLGINRTLNWGHRIENAVFLSLAQTHEEDIAYDLKDHEVDFVTRDALYQVAANIDNTKTLERELHSLVRAKTDKRKILIVKDGFTKVDTKGVEVFSLAEWLIGLD